MKLYTLGMSSNGRKAQAVIHHLNIPCEVVVVDAAAGELHAPEYLAINPNGMVPSLVDGDLTLWESNAIILYLATTKVPESPLFAPALRPDILRWLFWESSHYNRALGTIAYETIIKPMFGLGEPDARIIDDGQTQFKRFAATLEAHLKGRNHMVGTDWTLADYAVGSMQAAIDHVPVDWTNYPCITAFYQRLSANPHWSSTAPVSNNT
jgi:glutathione S-transferase